MSIANEQLRLVETLLASVWPDAAVQRIEKVQSLWNDYGVIVRLHLHSSELGMVPDTVIAKVVTPPLMAKHPRGWDTETSRQRKLRSYHVESHFYRSLAANCPAACRVPRCYSVAHDGEAYSMLLEDLDVAYPKRHSQLSVASVEVCLGWLAAFHAQWMGVQQSDPIGTGTYWYLATREDEFTAMPDSTLKASAYALDAALSGCRYQTLLHGDAKVANFCFSPNGDKVAAVDFQYTGVGCGMRDVAYLLGSCLSEDALSSHEDALLDYYFDALKGGVRALEQTPNSPCERAIEEEWRPLYVVAGADFHRFLEGWSPGHAKLTAYSSDLVNRAQQYIIHWA